MITTIIVILNVLVLALLATMYFTDPENGGLPFVLILCFTIFYDVYYWIVYSMVKRFVKKQKVREFLLLGGAILPFISILLAIYL